MEQPLSSHRTARLSSACFRIHLRPQTPLNLRQVKETQTAKHANIENAPAFSPKISGCWQLAFGMQNPLTGSLPQDRWSSPLFLVFHPIPPLMHLFCFQREPFFIFRRTKCHGFRSEPGQKCRQIWQICQLYIGSWRFNFEVRLSNYGHIRIIISWIVTIIIVN